MIDLKPFCGRDDPREYLNHPWQENGATFATNGHIGIQIKEMRADAVPVHATMAGRIEKLLRNAAANTIPLEIEFPSEAPKTCGHCGGARFVVARDCDECDGDGWFEHGSHTYDCKECRAQGEIHRPAKPEEADAKECWVCEGSGAISRTVWLKAYGVTYGFQEKYLRRLVALPSVRLFVSPDNTKEARFDFEGGSGVLMPCRF